MKAVVQPSSFELPENAAQLIRMSILPNRFKTCFLTADDEVPVSWNNRRLNAKLQLILIMSHNLYLTLKRIKSLLYTMRQPGFEPELEAWEAPVLPLDYCRR